MSTHHLNTLRLIRFENEALKLGWYDKNPRKCFSEEVARRSGELGNEHPFDEAIRIAERMLARLKKARGKQ